MQGNLIGRWREKETFKAEIYQQLTDYPFETITLRGPQDYQTYLTQMYGNYMQLPPRGLPPGPRRRRDLLERLRRSELSLCQQFGFSPVEKDGKMHHRVAASNLGKYSFRLL